MLILVVEAANTSSTAKSHAAAPPAVSYLPRPPPLWAQIASDTIEPVSPTPKSCPNLIKLTDESTCCCQTKRAVFQADAEVLPRSCTVFTLTEAWDCEIETQKCPSCPYRLIGPDCRELGLFNFNNRMLFTHELLDDYTSAFTSSETPFAAWVTGISRRYIGRQSRDFVKEKVFLAVWFSYINLVKLDSDMHCSQCGTTPKVTIWDGVTLAFNRRHILTTLHPPTAVTSESPKKESVKPAPGLQYIPDKSLRKDIRDILTGPQLCIPNSKDLTPPNYDGLTPEEKAASMKRYNTVLQQGDSIISRIDKVPSVIERLSQVDPDLAVFFDSHFGMQSIYSGNKPLRIYVKLFLQVSLFQFAF